MRQKLPPQLQGHNEWPRWPWLPLKRTKDGDLECALLHADDYDGKETPVYFANLYTVGYFPAPDWPKKVYPTLTAVFADGWEVD